MSQTTMPSQLRRRNVQKVEPAPNSDTQSERQRIQKSDSFINRCLAKVSNTVMNGFFGARQTRMKRYKLQTNYGFEEFHVPTWAANIVICLLGYFVVTPFIVASLKKAYDSLIKES